MINVIVGAFAAIAQQAPIPATRDIDVTPDASHENLARLSLALKELGARIRAEAVPDGLLFSHDARQGRHAYQQHAAPTGRPTG